MERGRQGRRRLAHVQEGPVRAQHLHVSHEIRDLAEDEGDQVSTKEQGKVVRTRSAMVRPPSVHKKRLRISNCQI